MCTDKARQQAACWVNDTAQGLTWGMCLWWAGARGSGGRQGGKGGASGEFLQRRDIARLGLAWLDRVVSSGDPGGSDKTRFPDRTRLTVRSPRKSDVLGSDTALPPPPLQGHPGVPRNLMVALCDESD